MSMHIADLNMSVHHIIEIILYRVQTDTFIA